MKNANLTTGGWMMGCLALVMASCTTKDDGYSAYYKDLPIDLPEVSAPAIPDYTASIVDFGAVNDGVTLNTDAFADAMSSISEKGGGHLVVPAGIWYTGPIEFTDNVDLHLENGAMILFSENLEDYELVETTFEGLSCQRAKSPLTAIGRKNISITGQGTVNGSGQCWRPVKKGKTTDNQWRELCRAGVVNERGNVWYPNERIAFANEHRDSLYALYEADAEAYAPYMRDFGRPNLLSFTECENVMLQGVTFENSPGWNLHPLLCKNLIIDSVNVRNPWYAQNGDGLDLESCTDVLVVNSTFDVGDDAICIKSGKDKEGRDRGVPCSNVLVTDCTVYHGHGGFVVGSEMSGGCKDIVVRNCLFDGTDVGLRFKSTRGRGGVVENIYIDGVNMYNIAGNALIFNLYYGGVEDTNTGLNADGQPVIPEVTEETPSFKDIYMSNIVCRSAERAALFNGLPEMPINNIVIKDSRFRAETGMAFSYVNGVRLENVAIDALDGEVMAEGPGVENLVVE